MKAYKIEPVKSVVVGILLVILTLGFCVVGTGAARPDLPPMDRQGGPQGQMDFDGETPPERPEGDSFRGGFTPDGETPDDFGAAFDGQPPRDGGFGPDAQRGFGGRGGAGHHGGGMDEELRESIEALEDGETKTKLETLLENVHTAMEKLMQADDSSREAAETAVREARDALNEALTAAGIEINVSEPPEKPEDDMRPEPPEGMGGVKEPETTENSKS